LRPRRTIGDENAPSALDCGSSSYRLPPSGHSANVQVGGRKAVAAATALQGAFGALIFMIAVEDRIIGPFAFHPHGSPAT